MTKIKIILTMAVMNILVATHSTSLTENITVK